LPYRQPPDEASARDGVELVVLTVVLNQDQSPVLFAEIKGDRRAYELDKLEGGSGHPHAPTVRSIATQLPHSLPVWVSLLRTSLGVYCGCKATGDRPPPVDSGI
jgi:hypothetical protein